MGAGYAEAGKRGRANMSELANDLRMWAKMRDLDLALVDDLIAAADLIEKLQDHIARFEIAELDRGDADAGRRGQADITRV